MALTFTDLCTNYTNYTSDPSAANLVIGKARINDTNKSLLGLHDWYFAEKTHPFTPIATDYTYDLPYDYGRMVAVTIELDDVVFSLEEVASHDEWQRVQMFRETQSSDIPEYYHITGDSLEIYPVPSSTAVTATGKFYYTRRVADMVADDYVTGTAVATNGSANIVGTGTTWTTAMAGRFFKINSDARWYELLTFGSTTTFALKKLFAGLTVTTTAYTIGEMSIIPEDYHNLLWYLPVATYWQLKKEPQQAAYWQALYDKEKVTFFNAYSKRSRTQILRARRQRYLGRTQAVGSWPDEDNYGY